MGNKNNDIREILINIDYDPESFLERLAHRTNDVSIEYLATNIFKKMNNDKESEKYYIFYKALKNCYIDNLNKLIKIRVKKYNKGLK